MEGAKGAVFQDSVPHKLDVAIKGHIYESFDKTVASYGSMGFQATNLAIGIEILNAILADKASKDTQSITLYVSMSYNLIFSPVRDNVALLIRKRIIDILVVSGGVIEADIGQLLGGKENGALTAFEYWFRNCVVDILCMNHLYTPSEFCNLLGRSLEAGINRGEISTSSRALQNSITYWAWKHNVPIFVPSWSDGTIAEILCGKPITVDLIGDIVSLNKSAMHAKQSAMVIIGGGIPKHHTCNANLMRNGADYAVYLNTAEEFDGSDAGASPDEAISWGKIKSDARYVKVHCDARISFPIMVAKCLSLMNI